MRWFMVSDCATLQCFKTSNKNSFVLRKHHKLVFGHVEEVESSLDLLDGHSVSVHVVFQYKLLHVEHRLLMYRLKIDHCQSEP